MYFLNCIPIRRVYPPTTHTRVGWPVLDFITVSVKIASDQSDLRDHFSLVQTSHFMDRVIERRANNFPQSNRVRLIQWSVGQRSNGPEITEKLRFFITRVRISPKTVSINIRVNKRACSACVTYENSNTSQTVNCTLHRRFRQNSAFGCLKTSFETYARVS